MKKTNIDCGDLYDPKVNKCQYFAHRVKERYVLYGGAYGGGKTAWLANEAIRLSVNFPNNRGFIGCRDGTDFKRNALQQLLKFLPADLYSGSRGGVHHQTDNYIKLINGSIIYYGGIGNESEAVKKISNMPELGWFGIDQAEEITENQFLLLDGRLRLNIPGIIYKALLTANPDPGWLRTRFIEDDKPDHRYIPAKPIDNPFLPEDYEKKLKEIYPEDMVRRLLEGDWDVPGVDILIPYRDIREAINRDLPAVGTTIGGLDVAEFGKAQTAFIARRGNKVLDIVSWAHMDTTFSAGAVAELIRKHKLVSLNIDSIGKGGEVYVLLRDDYPVKAINVSEASSDPLKYINKRAEHYGKLAKKFEGGEIDIPDHAGLSSELAGIRKKYRKASLQIEGKDVMRKKGMRSPDFADALMLAFIGNGVRPRVTMYRNGRKVR